MRAFECKMCGACCYGKGGIFLEEKEIKTIASFLGVDEAFFLEHYCEIRGGRYSVKTGPDRYCIFFDQEVSCTIHPVKPCICALWPFYPANLKDRENWALAKEACPGLEGSSSFEDFVRQADDDDLQ